MGNPYLFTNGCGTPPEQKGNIMEVLREIETTEYELDRLKREGCLVNHYTVNGEEWVYIVHPVKGKKHE